jgi:4-amino-4-deoxy-L-arabinose transferase-like glycosyltransferase
MSRRCIADYLIDAALLVAFIIDMNVGFTGLAVHEWLGLAIAVVVVVHLLLHADWIERISRRLTTNAPTKERLRWFVDAGLFVSVGLVIVTGVLISEVALSVIGTHDRFWRWLHVTAVDWAVYLVAIHLALSWRWIVRVTKGLMQRNSVRCETGVSP